MSEIGHSREDRQTSCCPRLISNSEAVEPAGVQPRTSRRAIGTIAAASLADATRDSGPAAIAAAVAAAIDAAASAPLKDTARDGLPPDPRIPDDCL